LRLTDKETTKQYKMNMKKTLLMMTLLLTLGMGVQIVAQNHRHTPREQEELVDSTQKGGVEAFSDTTTTDTSVVSTTSWDDDDWSDDDKDFFERHFSSIFGGAAVTGMAGMFFALAVLFILFVLAPVIILLVIFYFINKNRKEKMRLAQMAMQQGQPIPDKLLEENNTVSDEYQKGLRQCFVGVGLMIFLGLTAKEVGFGIGALVFCIGLGKIVAAKMAEKNNNIK